MSVMVELAVETGAIRLGSNSIEKKGRQSQPEFSVTKICSPLVARIVDGTSGWTA